MGDETIALKAKAFDELQEIIKKYQSTIENEGLTIKLPHVVKSLGADHTQYGPVMGDQAKLQQSQMEAQMAQSEHSFGGTMSEEELAEYFKEKPTKPKSIEWEPEYDQKTGKMKPMPMEVAEKIVEAEKRADESNDIYKISARIKNLVRATGSGATLTDAGERLANTYIHVAKAFYDFAETIPDEAVRKKLIELIRKHESMPADFIFAMSNSIR